MQQAQNHSSFLKGKDHIYFSSQPHNNTVLTNHLNDMNILWISQVENTTSQTPSEGSFWLLIQPISGFPRCIHSESTGPWWIVSLMQQMRLPLNMQAIQSHLHSLGQANLIMNEVMIGSYTWVVDHSCSFLNEGCRSFFNICWLCNVSVVCLV